MSVDESSRPAGLSSPDPRLAQVLALAQSCHYEAGHSQQVTALALSLFDQLQPLHGYGERERFYLLSAGLLHDIGWIEGGREHHKHSLRIILNTTILPFSHTERLIVGGIARYHRKALPHPDHDHFQALDEPDRRRVCLLAGLLRLADALDYNHQKVVAALRCGLDGDALAVTGYTRRLAEDEQAAARRESKLLSRALGRKIAFVWVVD
jgi:exopolyphosphatase/guanosine-5'-triphosphate,3'-diphosphate pyrophosphatase